MFLFGQALVEEPLPKRCPSLRLWLGPLASHPHIKQRFTLLDSVETKKSLQHLAVLRKLIEVDGGAGSERSVVMAVFMAAKRRVVRSKRFLSATQSNDVLTIKKEGATPLVIAG